jgi:hypothetical protein
MIVSPITPHSERIYSHRAGWGHLWSTKLNQKMAYANDYTSAPEVYFDHGMEFNEDSKGLNYFLKTEESYDKLAARLELIQNFTGRLYSLDIDCPLYGTRAKSRLCDGASARYKSLDFARIDAVCRQAQTVTMASIPTSTLVIGDSHSVSAWVPSASISRNDGKTLYGALKSGLIDQQLSLHPDVRYLRTYFGNIDIRHHLMRSPSPIVDTMVLASEYIHQLVTMATKYKLDAIDVVEPLPIENESRVLPKTGWYKGTPFYGTWSERNNLRRIFAHELEVGCREYGFNFIKWPQSFKNDQGELDFAVMEKPRSVHISPEFYLWKLHDKPTRQHEKRDQEDLFAEAA